MRSPRSRLLPTVLLVAAALGGLPAVAGASPDGSTVGSNPIPSVKAC
jgi:hypothetical protein